MTTTLPPDALQEPVRPVSLGFQILLGLANAGAAITLLPVLIVLIPAQVTQIDPVDTARSLAPVLTAGAFFALVGNLFAGVFSDRTTSRFGRRRPWLLVGSLGVTLGLLVLAASRTITQLALGWSMAQFFGNVLLSCFGAVLPDRVPVRQRGTTQAIVGLASPGAIILSDLYLASVPDPRGAYLPLAAVQVSITVLFLLLYREASLPKASLPPFRWGPFLASFWVSPRRFPNFARAWAAWFLLWGGYYLGSGSFFYLYVQNISSYAALYPGRAVQEGIASVQMMQIAVGIPLMMAAGVLADRSGRLKPFVMAGGLMVALGALALAGFSGWPAVLAGSVAIGAGFSLYYNLGQALISRLLPSALDRGKYLGVINIASTLPQVIMPAAGAAVLGIWGMSAAAGYQALFVAAALAALAGSLIIFSIRDNTH